MALFYYRTRYSLVRAKGEVLVLLYVFCSLFCRRFLDNPRADSRQILHAGVFWFRMCLLPFWGLASPAERKRGKWNFRYYRSQWGIFAFGVFWAISQQRVDRSATNFICLGTMSADVPPPLCGSSAPGGRGELKTQKMEGGLIRAANSYIYTAKKNYLT